MYDEAADAEKEAMLRRFAQLPEGHTTLEVGATARRGSIAEIHAAARRDTREGHSERRKSISVLGGSPRKGPLGTQAMPSCFNAGVAAGDEMRDVPRGSGRRGSVSSVAGPSKPWWMSSEQSQSISATPTRAGAATGAIPQSQKRRRHSLAGAPSAGPNTALPPLEGGDAPSRLAIASQSGGGSMWNAALEHAAAHTALRNPPTKDRNVLPPLQSSPTNPSPTQVQPKRKGRRMSV